MQKSNFHYTPSVVAALLCLSAGSVWAQATLSGTVRDEQNSPLAGVSVLVVGKTAGAITDAAGIYSLKLPAGNTQLRFSFIGYQNLTREVTMTGSDQTFDVKLEVSSSVLSEVVVVGSRASQRTLTDTPLPVDILAATDLKSTGQPTFDKALQYRVPSFNTINVPVNDASSLLDPYEIRNMGPSRTLILINGKRKNLSALNYIQASPGRGESGADISAIPTEAIKRVEILRDGASAQYGSDAIAGVMNIILKDKFDYGSVTLNAGTTHKGDGTLLGLSLNNGANFGSKSFINYTLSFQHTDLANRPGIVDAAGDAADFGADIATVESFLAIKPDAGNINGAPETTAAKFLVNGGISISDNTELYYNAAYVYKKVNSFANYRTPYWRLTDYGLLTPTGSPYLGYVPTFEGDLNDYNGTIGFRSEKNGWKSDVSFTVGGNQQLYTVGNTINRSLGRNSPILFKPGGYSFSHNVGNIDVSKALTEKLSFAIGSEFRAETFQIFAGDTASYKQGGADSFPGIGENNAIRSTRYNVGGYVDLGYDLTPNFLINGTARYEKYSDFGDAFVYKFSSRYKLADDRVTLRASYSTGFRAPSLHQINLQLAQASFIPGQGIQSKGIVNNRSAQAKVLGVPLLKPEKSINFTAGLGINPTPNLNFTLDYYSISVNDRIVLSSEIAASNPPTPQTAPLDKVLTDNGIVAVSFFTNGINTITQGIDLVANYRNLLVGRGKMTFNVAGNYTIKNERVGDIINPPLIAAAGKTIFDDTQEALLLSSRPKYKAIVGIDYTLGKVSFNLNNTVFGPTTFRQSGLDTNLKTVFDTKWVTDLGASFNLFKNTSLAVVVNNIFNVMPKWNLVALNEAGRQILTDPAKVKANVNAITFNGRYSNVTYDGSHFSQLGTTFNASLNVRF